MTATTEASGLPRSLHDIPGWFYWADQHLFDVILKAQADGPLGTLVELGVFKGKSAVLIGRHLRPSERFVVCDLFGASPDDVRNLQENTGSYRSLTRQDFERNYLAFHDSLPEIVADVSAHIVEHVAPGSARFVHVDASHLYEHVRTDIVSARSMLRPDGVVVFDDYRSEHTPGVAAAVWQAVATDGLMPFAHTPNKLYATYGDPGAYQRSIETWAATAPGFTAREEHVGSLRLLRVQHHGTAPKPADLAAIASEIRATRLAVDALSNVPTRLTRIERSLKRPIGTREAARTLAEDLIPPAVLRWARRARAAGRRAGTGGRDGH